MPHYVDQVLAPNEKLIKFSRPHWIIFGSSVAAFILAIIIGLYGRDYVYLQMPIYQQYEMYQVIALLGALIGVYWLLTASIQYISTEYAITSRRVIMKFGLISRNSLEMSLSKIEAVNVVQTVMGRLCGYGTIIVIGVGGTQDIYPTIPNPLEFRKEIQDHIVVPDARQETRS